jgi:hypothetical protein
MLRAEGGLALYTYVSRSQSDNATWKANMAWNVAHLNVDGKSIGKQPLWRSGGREDNININVWKMLELGFRNAHRIPVWNPEWYILVQIARHERRLKEILKKCGLIMRIGFIWHRMGPCERDNDSLVSDGFEFLDHLKRPPTSRDGFCSMQLDSWIVLSFLWKGR